MRKNSVAPPTNWLVCKIGYVNLTKVKNTRLKIVIIWTYELTKSAVDGVEPFVDRVSGELVEGGHVRLLRKGFDRRPVARLSNWFKKPRHL